MKKKNTFKVIFTFIIIIGIVIFAFLVIRDNKKDQEYAQIVFSDLTASEKAEKLRKLNYKNKTYNSEEAAKVYQLLADGEYVQARETNEQCVSRIPESRLTVFIENELTDANEMLIAYHDIFDLTGTKSENYHYANEWLPDADGIMGNYCHISMLGYSQEEDLRADCSTSPVAGKLLVLYKLNDTAKGANLDAMGSLGEEAWPQSLSEVSHILEIEYSVHNFPARDYSKTGTQVVARTANYTITLTDTSGNVIYKETLKGEMPDSTWVTQNAYNERTFRPEWTEVSKSINKAFQSAGLEYKAPEK